MSISTPAIDARAQALRVITQAEAELLMAKQFLHEAGTDPEAWLDSGLREIAKARALLAFAVPAPLDVILFCPKCGAQHVDKPEPEKGWTNPPHKSHLCHVCGLIWRPADVPTNGVERVQTRGSADTWEAVPAPPPLPAKP